MKRHVWTTVLLLAVSWVVLFVCSGLAIKLLKRHEPTANEQLAILRNDTSTQNRIAALRAIPEDDPGARSAIIHALNDSDAQVRDAALWRVRNSNLVAAAVPALIERAKVDPPNDLLFSTLATARDPRTVEPMIALLHDDQRCDYAAEVLGEAGDSRAFEPLQNAVQTARQSGKPVSKKGLVALGKLRDTRAFEVLVEFLVDPDCKESAIDALIVSPE